MSTPVAIANAACDALNIDNVTLPLTHSKVHSYITSNIKEKPRSKINSNKKIIAVQAKDKFGDYGIISVIYLSKNIH